VVIAVSFSFGSAIRRRLALDRIHLPQEMALIGLVAGFLVPGLAVYIRGPRLWGKAVLASCGLLFLSFIMWFGHPGREFRPWSAAFRFTSPVLCITAVRCCWRHRSDPGCLFTLLDHDGARPLIYLPIRNVILQRWLVPLRVRGNVL